MGPLIRVLHLADLHLGYEPPWSGIAKARRKERDGRLAKAVAWALQNDIDLVLIAGDLFETHRPPAELVDTVIRELNRLVAAGIGLVTVPGNHDEISYHDSVYRRERQRWPGILVENPNFEKAATIHCRGMPVHIYSLAYTSGLTRTHPPLSAFPRSDEAGFHIALLHGSLDWDRGDRSLPIDGKSLEQSGYDYVALGHIHQHMVRGKRPPIVYAGMIDGKHFDDPGVGGYTVVTLDAAGASVALEPAGDVRPLLTLSVDAGLYDTYEELVQAVRADLPREAAVRLVVTGTPGFSLSPERLARALEPLAYYVEAVDETLGLADELIQQLALEPTVRGAFVRRMGARLVAASPDEEKLIRRALLRGLQALAGEEARR